jgi:hypothetical protein
MLTADDAVTRLAMVEQLHGLADVSATKALAKLAIYSQEKDIRRAAVRALKLRRDRDYTDILVSGLNYPWPQVAERAGEAIAELGRTDLVPQLIEVLDRPDPRAPRRQEIRGKQVTAVRELVRINHVHNCMLCHAPATAARDKLSPAETARIAPVTAQVPVPADPGSITEYYNPVVPDILIRFDVTYLRQDFSLNLNVVDDSGRSEMQRYDFVVRTREVTEKEAAAYRELLQPGRAKGGSPYHLAAQSALRRLTGRDGEATAAAWRRALRL